MPVTERTVVEYVCDQCLQIATPERPALAMRLAEAARRVPALRGEREDGAEVLSPAKASPGATAPAVVCGACLAKLVWLGQAPDDPRVAGLQAENVQLRRRVSDLERQWSEHTCPEPDRDATRSYSGRPLTTPEAPSGVVAPLARRGGWS
jgi:hypothetical protein